MKRDDVKIGEYYKWNWDATSHGPDLLFAIGRDPFTGKLVFSCKDWNQGVDFIDDDEDFEMIEPI